MYLVIGILLLLIFLPLFGKIFLLLSKGIIYVIALVAVVYSLSILVFAGLVFMALVGSNQ